MASRMGKDLADDPEYQARLAAGLAEAPKATAIGPATWRARLSVVLFLLGVIAVVALGTFPELRVAGRTRRLRECTAKKCPQFGHRQLGMPTSAKAIAPPRR